MVPTPFAMRECGIGTPNSVGPTDPGEGPTGRGKWSQPVYPGNGAVESGAPYLLPPASEDRGRERRGTGRGELCDVAYRRRTGGSGELGPGAQCTTKRGYKGTTPKEN